MSENKIIRSSVSISVATESGYRSTETNSDEGPMALFWAVSESTRLLAINGMGDAAIDAARATQSAVAVELGKAPVVLRFEGKSDDTFGEYAHTNDDYDNCASGKPIEWLVAHRESGVGLIVTGQYCPGASGGWLIGIANWDPDGLDTDMPQWPMRFERAERTYSPALVIEAPVGVSLTCITRGDVSE
jgi:hypothetical protein